MFVYSRKIVVNFKPCWLFSMEDVRRVARSGRLVVFLPEYQAQDLDVPANCSLLRLQGLSARATPSIAMSKKTPYWALLNHV
ncbi:hypothetical protein R5R35_006465 [Gryllus longicercus]|uniref:Uncharacterized protein n=1 Tax=Gryllus longicercus TaxID=2509291 RepID=A0AAN9VUW7_9ORTH